MRKVPAASLVAVPPIGLPRPQTGSGDEDEQQIQDEEGPVDGPLQHERERERDDVIFPYFPSAVFIDKPVVQVQVQGQCASVRAGSIIGGTLCGYTNGPISTQSPVVIEQQMLQ